MIRMRWLNLAAIVACCSFNALTQHLIWTQPHTFGGEGDDFGYSIEPTADGGFIVAGITASYGAGERDVWLLKFNSNGFKEWDRTFGTDYDDMGRFACQTTDGGYIITGMTQSAPGDNDDLWLIKTDTDGEVLWSQRYGGDGNELGSHVLQTVDGGFIVVGRTQSFGNGGYDIWLIKTSSNGRMQWDYTFGSSGNDYGYWLERAPDGGYVIAGYTESLSSKKADICLIKTDAQGQQQWTRFFGGDEDDFGASVKSTRDGGYVIAGETHSFGQGNGDAWLIKTDLQGQEEWNRTFGGAGNEGVYPVLHTNDGGFIVAGWTESFGAGETDIWLIKTDAFGNGIWNNSLGGTGLDWGLGAQQTTMGTYFITGFQYKDENQGYDLMLIFGEVVEGSPPNPGGSILPTSFNLYPPHPNPFNDQTVIAFDLPMATTLNLELYDLLGQRVSVVARGNYNAGTHRAFINAENLSSGVYFILLRAGNQSFVQRCFLLR